MIPTSKRPTVEMFYGLYARQPYEPNDYYCVSSDFVQLYVTEKKSFTEDELSIKQEKEFILTTLKQVGAPTKNRT
jgi:hypothetical protein